MEHSFWKGIRCTPKWNGKMDKYLTTFSGRLDRQESEISFISFDYSSG